MADGNYTATPEKHWLWFYVTADWNVYPNFSEIASWWKLGNLKEDSWKSILDNYAEDKILGLKVMNKILVKELAEKYGNLNVNKLYMGKGEIIDYWIGMVIFFIPRRLVKKYVTYEIDIKGILQEIGRKGKGIKIEVEDGSDEVYINFR